jgi:hypothetical protein
MNNFEQQQAGESLHENEAIVQSFSEQEDVAEVKIEIVCNPVPVATQQSLAIVLGNLKSLKDEIEQKIAAALTRAQNIESVMEKIMTISPSVIDERKKNALTESVATYTQLLNGIVLEIDVEIADFSPYAHAGHPTVISVPEKNSQIDSSIYLEGSVRFLRSQVKSIRKYLMVSYSRYMYGFELQEKKLIYLVHQLNNMKK